MSGGREAFAVSFVLLGAMLAAGCAAPNPPDVGRPPGAGIIEVTGLDMLRAQAVDAAGASCVFYALPWSDLCRRATPWYEAVAQQERARAQFFYVDVARHPDVLRPLRVWHVPTFVVYRNGTEVGRVQDPRSAQDLAEGIADALSRWPGER